MRRHAGTRIEFQQNETAVFAQHRVNASPATGSDRRKGRFAGRKNIPRHCLIQLRGALVLHNVAEILVLVVVIAFGRLDFNDRKGLAAQNGNRKLPPEPALFNEHLVVKTQSLRERLTNLFHGSVLEFVHTHRRAFAGRLDHNVASECVQNFLRLIRTRCHKTLGNRDARLRPDATRRVLIHRKGTGAYTRTRVRNPEVLQHPLHAAVFAEAAVQRNHRSVVLTTQRHEVCLGRINLMRVASGVLQSLQNARAAGKRHLALAAKAPHQHRDAAQRLGINRCCEIHSFSFLCVK